nr:MAG TPA: hypothetical protein [Caudoviricetes sp.]
MAKNPHIAIAKFFLIVLIKKWRILYKEVSPPA